MDIYFFPSQMHTYVIRKACLTVTKTQPRSLHAACFVVPTLGLEMPPPLYVHFEVNDTIGGYSFPFSSVLGVHVHHCSQGILSMTLGMWLPHPTHDS